MTSAVMISTVMKNMTTKIITVITFRIYSVFDTFD